MRILVSILLLLLFVPDWTGTPRLPLLPREGWVKAEPVTLDWRHPERVRVGALTFLGGVRLRGPGPAFGGFSALAVQGDRFTLLSDGGNLVTFRMGADWTPRTVRFAALPGGPGRGWNKRDRDSESLTTDPATGRHWVGFETENAIWRYAPGLARAEAAATPPAMADWPPNRGAEAMVRLRDGRLVLLAEDEEGKSRPTLPGLIFASDPVAAPRRAAAFRYAPPAGFRPTDMAQLPDGRIVVLNRRFALLSGFTAALSLIPRDAIRPGAVVRGKQIARFEGPVLHDNFEGIVAVQQGRDTILWIVSDDNQWPFQRALLLKFRLDT